MITFTVLVISFIAIICGSTGAEHNDDKNHSLYILCAMVALLGYIVFVGALLYCFVKILMFFGIA